MAGQQFTPWQKMRAYETQVRKIEDNWRIRLRNKGPEAEEGVVYAVREIEQPWQTWYNNGKCNACCKTPYDYNFSYCLGYDQSTHRCDRKHPFFYMNIDREEEYPCRSVPICTNSHYGFRPPIDPMLPIAKKKVINQFYRNHGASYCFDANGYQQVKPTCPTWAFRANQSFGYTYAPPVN